MNSCVSLYIFTMKNLLHHAHKIEYLAPVKLNMLPALAIPILDEDD